MVVTTRAQRASQLARGIERVGKEEAERIGRAGVKDAEKEVAGALPPVTKHGAER
jgi:hypothetical protein